MKADDPRYHDLRVSLYCKNWVALTPNERMARNFLDIIKFHQDAIHCLEQGRCAYTSICVLQKDIDELTKLVGSLFDDILEERKRR